MRILLLSDIHGNFPALKAVEKKFGTTDFDHIINCGDSIVYAPYPNETLAWLANNKTLSILGNTDEKIIKLLRGKSFKKPRKPEKRIMYTWTADELTRQNRKYLQTLSKHEKITLHADSTALPKTALSIGIFHGSPAADHEFLFADTPDSRFVELTQLIDCKIIVTGHSHCPYHKYLAGSHFVNPGSVGRMFDGDPRASCAILTVKKRKIRVKHYRITYPVKKVTSAMKLNRLPAIYSQMFIRGKKLN